MHPSRAAGLRQVADNLDKLADEAADEAADRGHRARAASLRNNAAFLRRSAVLEHAQETAMGKFADKIHAVEKERDAARSEAASLRTQLGQAGEAQKTLDALTAAGKLADDADVAALTDDPEDATPQPPATPPADVPAAPDVPPVTPPTA